MDISFINHKMQKTFNSEKELKKVYGKLDRYIRRRMTVLRAVHSLSDVPIRLPERRHELAGDKKGNFAVDLVKNYRLVFKPNNDPLPISQDGGLDLKRITAITIVEVEDYH
ncbi:MAG: type II toxin-antitoxin system RelE/ParE family toxin [Nitrospirae bacterium]|nr:type II toxin-antitoxin system RelE/ParE family toxin [Nitrospirota bacterium]